MSNQYSNNPYMSPSTGMSPSAGVVAQAPADERLGFLRRTYAHLGGAIAMFVLLEYVLLEAGVGIRLLGLVGTMPFGWLLFLGMFMVVSWVANSWAHSSTSSGVQYAGLGLYVVAEAIIFSPLLTIAALKDPAIPLTAGVTTLCLFGVLTSVVFVTRKDFSFLGTFLTLGMFAAIALIVVSIVCQFALGPIFTVVMIALACGYILYYTSNVLHHYHSSQHVAASLTLFASVALLLWYVVQMFMYSSD